MKEESREKKAWVVLSVRMDLKRAGGEVGETEEGKGTDTGWYREGDKGMDVG